MEISTYKTIDIKFFGSFRILIDGVNFFHGSKRNSVVIELSKLLLSGHNEKKSVLKILEELDKEEYLNPKKTMNLYINRVTHALKGKNSLKLDISSDIFVSVVDGYVLIKLSDKVNIDADLFKEIYNSTKWREKSLDKAKKLKEALELYTEKFLIDTNYSNWVIPLRQYYESMYNKMADEIIQIYFNNKEYSQLIIQCQNVFEINPLIKSINVFYIKTLIEENKIYDAKAHLKNYSKNLKENMDEDLDIEFINLQKQIDNILKNGKVLQNEVINIKEYKVKEKHDIFIRSFLKNTKVIKLKSAYMIHFSATSSPNEILQKSFFDIIVENFEENFLEKGEVFIILEDLIIFASEKDNRSDDILKKINEKKVDFPCVEVTVKSCYLNEINKKNGGQDD